MLRENETNDSESNAPDTKSTTAEANAEFSSLCHYVKVLPTPEVPKHFPFNHSSTRWLLSNIASESGVRRIILKHRQQPFLLCHHFEVPDKPSLLIKRGILDDEKSAFSVRTTLYLTPIGIAVYLKQNNALENLVRHLTRDQLDFLKSTVIQPRCIMIDNQSSPEGDICSFSIGTLALLRMNIYALIVLMRYGVFDPHAEFVFIKKQQNDETIFYYRDVLDFLVYQLRKQPCMPVATMTQQLLQNSCMFAAADYENSPTNFHLNMFERPLRCSQQPKEEKYMSIMQRLLLLVLDQTYFSYEVGTPILSVLEVIVKTNYLAQMANVTKKTNVPSRNHKISSVMMDKICLFSEMPFEKSKRLFENDVLKCIALLIRWYENCVEEIRESHCHRIVNLMTKILLDSRLITIMFEKSESSLLEKFASLTTNRISHKINRSEATIKELKILMLDIICESTLTKKKFLRLINKNQEFPALVPQQSQKSYRNNSEVVRICHASSVCGDDHEASAKPSNGGRKQTRTVSPSGTVIIADRSISRNANKRNGQLACITMLRSGNPQKVDSGVNNNNDLSFAGRCLRTNTSFSNSRVNLSSKRRESACESKTFRTPNDEQIRSRRSRRWSSENTFFMGMNSNAKPSCIDGEHQRPPSRQRRSDVSPANKISIHLEEESDVPRLIGKIIGDKGRQNEILDDESFASKILFGDSCLNTTADGAIPRLDLPVSSDEEGRTVLGPDLELSSRSASA